MDEVGFALPPYDKSLYYFDASVIIEALGFDYGLEDEFGRFKYSFAPWGGEFPTEEVVPTMEDEWSYRLEQSLELQQRCDEFGISIRKISSFTQSRETKELMWSALNMIRLENHVMGCLVGKALGGDPRNFRHITPPNGVSDTIENTIEKSRYNVTNWVLDREKQLKLTPASSLKGEYNYRICERKVLECHLKEVGAPFPCRKAEGIMKKRNIVGEIELPLWVVLHHLRCEINCMLLRRSRYALARICMQLVYDNQLFQSCPDEVQSTVLKYNPYLSESELSDEE